MIAMDMNKKQNLEFGSEMVDMSSIMVVIIEFNEYMIMNVMNIRYTIQINLFNNLTSCFS